MKVEVWCDGACSIHKDQIGGYACIVKWNNKIKEVSGAVLNTTNNQMELKAAIVAFETVNDIACFLPCEVVVVSDSQYVINGMNSWVHRWQNIGWRTASNRPVKNQELWKELLETSKEHNVEWMWTQGHSNCLENNRCDELAVAAIEQKRLDITKRN